MLAILLKNIRLNRETGFYEVVEAGSKYQIDPTLYDNLVSFFKNYPTSLIANWYRDLSEADKKKVFHSSAFSNSK